MKKIITIIGAIFVALILTAGSCEGEPSAISEERETASEQLSRLSAGQPVPEFGYSQIRQNLIEITLAQADTTQTTSFFFNMGVADPISNCPSIGYPIPTTAQLTNPSQIARRGNNSGRHVIPQAEQTGIYTGDSTGTYVICVDGSGEAYGFYWEGFVSTISGPGKWNLDTKQIELAGDPTGNFSTSEEDVE